MKNYNEGTYGERISGVYENLHSEYDQKFVEILNKLTRNSPILELCYWHWNRLTTSQGKGSKSTESMLLKSCLKSRMPAGGQRSIPSRRQ